MDQAPGLRANIHWIAMKKTRGRKHIAANMIFWPAMMSMVRFSFLEVCVWGVTRGTVKEAFFITLTFFSGQEEATINYDEGVAITPFNLDEEMQEGHFDSEGNYFIKKEEQIRDNWLDNIDWVIAMRDFCSFCKITDEQCVIIFVFIPGKNKRTTVKKKEERSRCQTETQSR